MLEKAIRLQENKDNLGTSLPNPAFVLLSSLPDDHLLEVASDAGLALLPRVGSCSELLSLVWAKEIIQAALAQAQVKFDKQKAKAEAAVAAYQADPSVSMVGEQPAATTTPSVRSPVLSAPLVPSPRPRWNKRVLAVRPVCARILRKTPARQARVSPKVSK
jgi:hypothetical protein